MLVVSTIDEIVPEALVIAFAMVVDGVLGKRVTEVPLTQWNETVQALFLDRTNKPLRVRVTVWRAKRCLDHAHTGDFKRLPDGEAPLPITIAEEHPLSVKRTVARGGQLTHDLEHECFVRMRRGQIGRAHV